MLGSVYLQQKYLMNIHDIQLYRQDNILLHLVSVKYQISSTISYIEYKVFFEVSKKTNTNMKKLNRIRQKLLKLKWNYTVVKCPRLFFKKKEIKMYKRYRVNVEHTGIRAGWLKRAQTLLVHLII